MTVTELEAFCLSLSTPAPDSIDEAERHSHLKTVAARMLTGPLQGRLLQFIATPLQPKCIVEVGSYTGYSALWLAMGLAPGGKVHTIELDPEKAWIIKENIERASMSDRIIVHIGDAMEILPTLPKPWDLVYLDGDKERYTAYYQLIMPFLRPGGIFLADNVLWKNMPAKGIQDKMTAHISAFNKYVLDDPACDNLVLPLRDGLLWARKI
jgi:caffeoyl-CoA O-methyltransferase